MRKLLRGAIAALSLLLACAVMLFAFIPRADREIALCHTRSPPISGPLRVSRANPRYFATPEGRIVYLTGSHNWDNLVDRRANPPFDYGAYLAFLQAHNHNFIRLWTRENAAPTPGDPSHDNEPLPFARTGPGIAADGKPRFDLTRFNPQYFERLRSRVRQAHDRGIYVMVMLFNGFSIQFKGGHRTNPWPGHPFNAANNINGIDGDANGNGQGEEMHTLQVPAVTRLQEAYVRKVVDTVNDLDVLYEIANESHRGSADWQRHMILLIQDYERGKDKQNPVVMSYPYDGEGGDTAGANATLFASPAQAVAPGADPNALYRTDPPPADGSKVIFSDTDHLWGVGATADWAWKSFLRGLNPLFMDPLENPAFESVRRSLGQTRAVADAIDVSTMRPRPDLASSGYCLANPGSEYLVFVPSDAHPLEARIRGWMRSAPILWRYVESSRRIRAWVRLSVEVDLTDANEPLRASWFDTSTGRFKPGKTVPGGRKAVLRAPFPGPLILHLVRARAS